VGGPSWLADILAAVMIAIAIYCVSRLVISRAGHRATHHDVDLVHGVMGVAMAGMLVTRLNPLPGSVWAVLFGVATAWFGWQVSRVYRLRSTGRLTSGLATGHYVPHLVMCGAMVYMLLAVAVVKSGSSAGGMAMGGAGGAHFEFLAFILALYMVGYVMWQADRLPSLARVGAVVAGYGSAVDPAGTGLARAAASQPAALGQQPAAAGPSTQLAEAPADEAAPRTGLAGKGPLSPRLAACCQIAMGITMGYMLVLML
jgi:hypothetical protein